jgi:LemA protein
MSWVLIGIVLLIVVAAIVMYNGLVQKKNRTQEAWSQIDVELKRRHDLIPNLVETVKGYAAHESGTFEKVTEARAGAINAGQTGDPAQIAQAENMLTQSLKSLFAVAENYPQLRAVESFTQLQEQITATEDKIEFARRYYNGSARDFNIALQTFPGNMVAGVFGFKGVAYFEADATDREVPVVDFTGAGGPPAAISAQSGPPPTDSQSGPPEAG